MSVLTIRVSECKLQRLKLFAESRGLSVNKLIEELSTVALAQHDAEMRFRLLVSRGSAQSGLKLLDKLDRGFERKSRR